MVKNTIEVSDGRHYKLAIAVVQNPEPEYRWSVKIVARATNFDSPDLVFDAVYPHQFFEDKPMDETEVIEDTRSEVVMFFEGSANQWSMDSARPYYYRLYRNW